MREGPFVVARGLGFEPRLEVPKTPVLPLDDPRTQAAPQRSIIGVSIVLTFLGDTRGKAYQRPLPQVRRAG